MRVRQEYLLDLIGRLGARFQIPIYQRVYAWTQRQCDELWADVLCAGNTGADHFIGTVLYGMDSEAADEGCAVLDLIDGQQRFTTALLLLAALRDVLAESDDATDDTAESRMANASTEGGMAGAPSESDTAGIPAEAILPDPAQIDSTLLFTVDADGIAPKLTLSEVDQPTFRAILERTALPEESMLSTNLTSNHAFFKERLLAAGSIRTVWRGLQRLLVIGAQLEDGDQPQAVFESLNARGKALSPADLIRNLLLARFGYDEQKRLFQQYWEPIERMFPESADMPDLYVDAALHAWLEEHAPDLPLQDASEIYTAFKAHLRTRPDLPLEELLRSLHDSCALFAQHLSTADAKRHLDWAQGKLTGLVSERKLFGD